MDFIVENNKVYLNNELGELLAEVTFPNISEYVVEINHTFVDESLRGQGIASKLLEMAANKIKEDGKKAKPTCSYAVNWFEKHESYWDLLSL
ncbi:GNAT family N-acetyltransferase [Paludicola sp. MB14-C6]|uniref:GNAT family N-acetyltransferase n=1 Tax=Paludihabitans sp. MB14-C6 TaxID=3070656 RepID=UPI0027DC1799|nr:GNAT family N-acetyltransferase [Paludicola sp. MB14-C6]WMJ22422.1 GNAT family N-acetyltransferase [Paludicola sp. MB14-C6]